jgi:acyl phosphate:glycerol-3-phosphate acyltransferase
MDMHWVYAGIAMVLSYLCGSIPTSVWWGRAFYGLDVREHGSRNAGATNTFRVLGPKAGVPVLLFDVLKGFVPVRVLALWSDLDSGSADFAWLRVVMVLAAVVGHLYPVFAGFRGGKGVATSFGGILALHRGAALICLGVFLLVFLLSKYVSLGSLCAAVAFAIAVQFIDRDDHLVLQGFSIVLCALVFWTHRTNIGRLMKGEENRMRLFTRSTP